MNATPHILESALLLLAAFLIGCLVGYLARRMFGKAPAERPAAPAPAAVVPAEPETASAPAATEQPVAEAPVTAEAVATPAPAPRARATKRAKAVPETAPKTAAPSEIAEQQTVAVPANTQAKPDNLRAINGLGPKMESKLHAAGVTQLDEIAGWSRKAADAMDAKLGAQGRIERDDWVGQAKALLKKKS
ncbi:hypothetical protein [Pelagibacterium montanilacus]|uniref:hypothetical protein n=1 Tax=Pelagibacterium montanilacus TaxID=2185280 RepID=UPI000F8F021C|nr:hypothetical protein [Pelagibacterium montanilacus]